MLVVGGLPEFHQPFEDSSDLAFPIYRLLSALQFYTLPKSFPSTPHSTILLFAQKTHLLIFDPLIPKSFPRNLAQTEPLLFRLRLRRNLEKISSRFYLLPPSRIRNTLM